MSLELFREGRGARLMLEPEYLPVWNAQMISPRIGRVLDRRHGLSAVPAPGYGFLFPAEGRSAKTEERERCRMKHSKLIAAPGGARL